MSLRRKIAIATWDAPREGNIYGKVTLDARPALEYIQELRQKDDIHVTLTHLVVRAVAFALKESTGLNGYISFGKFKEHKRIDLSVIVALDEGKNLSMVKLTEVDRVSITQIAQKVNQRVEELRSGRDKAVKQNMQTAKLIPWFLLKPILKLIGWISTSLGWSIPSIGIQAFPFGTAIITNVGVFGVDEAYVPPTPFAGVPLYLLMGAVKDAVYAEEGEVKIRQEITLTATMDHRFVDGAQAAVLARTLKSVFAHPKQFDLLS